MTLSKHIQSLARTAAFRVDPGEVASFTDSKKGVTRDVVIIEKRGGRWTVYTMQPDRERKWRVPESMLQPATRRYPRPTIEKLYDGGD